MKFNIEVIALILLAIGVGTLLLLVSTDTFNVLGGDPQEPLDCSNIVECKNMLDAAGMPDGYLDDNNFIIECIGGVCHVVEK